MPVLGGLGGTGQGGVTIPWAGGLGGIQLGGGFQRGLVPPPPPLCVSACVQTNTNAINITFGPAQPLMLDPFGPNDALNRANYDVVPFIPPTATKRLVQWVEKVDDFTVKLWMDGPLDANATYRIEVSNILDVDCNPIDVGCNVCLVETFFPPPELATEKKDERLDLANPQLLSDAKQRDGVDAPLGTFQVNQRGDIALEANPEYLRKRVIRRATTGLGEFFHLPNYGFGEPLKGKISISKLRKIQGAAIRQIKLEPDVRSVAVRVRQVSPQNPNILVLEISVEDTSGRRDNFTVPVDFGAQG
jgi:hypothetical protein